MATIEGMLNDEGEGNKLIHSIKGNNHLLPKGKLNAKDSAKEQFVRLNNEENEWVVSFKERLIQLQRAGATQASGSGGLGPPLVSSVDI